MPFDDVKDGDIVLANGIYDERKFVNAYGIVVGHVEGELTPLVYWFGANTDSMLNTMGYYSVGIAYSESVPEYQAAKKWFGLFSVATFKDQPRFWYVRANNSFSLSVVGFRDSFDPNSLESLGQVLYNYTVKIKSRERDCHEEKSYSEEGVE